MRKSTAFCSGHITGFFEIHHSKNLLETGSRGAGLCLSLGATSEVRIQDSKIFSVKVNIDGTPSRAEVTKEAMTRLFGARKMAVSVDTTLDLPVSQGFGMSAAGALSASIAGASLLGTTRTAAFQAAHCAEIVKGGGLGDISALYRGGITIRKKPGLPPIGEVLRIKGKPRVVLCVVGRKLLTKRILSDPVKRRSINKSGSMRVDELLRAPTIERLMSLSSGFAFESGLASDKVTEAINAASKLGMASMSMLGNSVFAIGDTKGLARVLSDFGTVYVCDVDLRGPRLVH